VLHTAAGDGWLVRRLTAEGVSAYGWTPGRSESSGRIRRHDLRDETWLPPACRRVRGPRRIILSGVVDGMTAGERLALLDLVVDRLSPEGRSWCTRCLGGWESDQAPVAADLCGGHPLRLATWSFLLGEQASTSARSRPEGSTTCRRVLGDTVTASRERTWRHAPLLPADPLVRAWLASRPSSVGPIGSAWPISSVEWPRRPDQGAVGVLALYGLPARSTWWRHPDAPISGHCATSSRTSAWSGGAAGGPVSAEIAAAYFAAADVYVTASVADTEGTRRACARGAGRQPRCSDTAAGVVLTWRSPPRRRTIAASSPTPRSPRRRATVQPGAQLRVGPPE